MSFNYAIQEINELRKNNLGCENRIIESTFNEFSSKIEEKKLLEAKKHFYQIYKARKRISRINFFIIFLIVYAILFCFCYPFPQKSRNESFVYESMTDSLGVTYRKFDTIRIYNNLDTVITESKHIKQFPQKTVTIKDQKQNENIKNQTTITFSERLKNRCCWVSLLVASLVYLLFYMFIIPLVILRKKKIQSIYGTYMKEWDKNETS